MAHSVSAKKRIRQNETHRARNRWRLRRMRTAISSFQDKLAHGSIDEAKDAYRAASIAIDRTAAKGVIHKKQAARRKSRLNTMLKAKATA
jgi:small subunit ribosomal protein S20